MRLRRAPAAPTTIARKAAPAHRPRPMDRALERQADEATQAALHGQIDVARVLTPAPAARVEAPSSIGMSLPTEVRQEAERAFGADLAAVRVHRDPAAAAIAEREQARAFTAGADVYFAEGEYDPGSTSGRTLLYHELAHVVQQTGARVRSAPRTSPPPRTGGTRRG